VNTYPMAERARGFLMAVSFGETGVVDDDDVDSDHDVDVVDVVDIATASDDGDDADDADDVIDHCVADNFRREPEPPPTLF